MKLQNIIKKFQVLKFSIGLIAIGLLFTAFSVFILIKPDGNYQKTDAITRVCHLMIGKSEIKK